MRPEHRALIEQLHAAAAAVRAAVAAVPPGAVDRPPAPGEWSARETLVHLRNVAVMVHGLRLRRLWYERDPVFADYDEPAFRREDLGRGEAVADLLATTVAELEQAARLLSALPDDRWARQGRHPELGPMSIEFLARRLGEHALEHAEQIAAAARHR